LRAELRETFLRAAEADRLNEERKARLPAEREGRTVPPATGAESISGNYSPAEAQNHSGRTVRIGARIVEG